MRFLFCTILIYLSVIFSFTTCDKNKDRSFLNIKNPIPCVRRFNATHQIGCGKLDYTSYNGIVYAVREEIDILRLDLLNNLNKRKLVIVVIPSLFKKVVDYYKKDTSEKINGIVLLASPYYLKDLQGISYSDDAQIPNYKFGLYNNNPNYQFAYNLAGSSFIFEDFKIPFYVITEDDEAKMPFDDCFDKFNKNIFDRIALNVSTTTDKFEIKPTDLLCGMQLGLEMYGAVSSSVCVRRSNILHTIESNSFCDPLGGSNYLTFISQKPSNKLPIVMVTVRIDSFTMYEYYTPGANEPISSIIGLLAIVETLAKYRSDMKLANLLFVLFDNEAFDYGGSSRFANDLVLDKFPKITVNDMNDENSFALNKENITTLVELNQLGSVGLDANENLFIHKDPISYTNNPNITKIIDNLTQKLESFSNGKIKSLTNINQPLPPSSLHSFLRQGFKIGGISITDYDKQYKNNFYHGVFDTPESIGVVFPENITEFEAYNYSTKLATSLQPLLTSIAKTLYSLSSDAGSTFNGQVDILTLNKLIYCFYKNSTCMFFKSILTEDEWKGFTSLLDSTLPKQKLSFYTSVYDNKISGKWISFLLLRYFSRNLQVEKFNVTECKKDSPKFNEFIKETNLTIKSLIFLNKTTCVASSIYSVSSVSPAFDNVDDGYLVNTDKFSAWAESSWASKTIQMKLFMFTCDSVKTTSITLGIISLLSSVFITYFVNKYSAKLFSIKTQEPAAQILE